MIDEPREATMKKTSRPKRKRAPRGARATRDLLCLLATYDTYGRGAPWPGCLRRLAALRAVR